MRGDRVMWGKAHLLCVPLSSVVAGRPWLLLRFIVGHLLLCTVMSVVLPGVIRGRIVSSPKSCLWRLPNVSVACTRAQGLEKGIHP